MKKKFTNELKLEIVKEALESKDKIEIAEKYDIHFTTLYTWIRLFERKEGRDYKVTFKLNEQEKKAFYKKCEEMGYQKDVSSYVRKVLFSKHIATGNPRQIIKELYSARAELNKSGSNLNQIANYTNFLRSQNYFEDGFVKDLNKQMEQMEIELSALRKVIDKTLTKI
jgi:transposase-like protein